MANNGQDCLKNMPSSSNATDNPPAQSQSNATSSQNVIDLDPSDSEDPIALSKDDLDNVSHEPSSRQTRSSTSQSKSKYHIMSRLALVNSLIIRDNTIAELKEQKSEAGKEMKKEKADRFLIQKENSKLRREIAEQRAESRRVQKEKVDLQNTFAADLKEAKQRYVDAQKDWKAKVDESIYQSLPDDMVRGKLRQLWDSCKNWVREWYCVQISLESTPFYENIIAQCASDQRYAANDVLVDKLNSRTPTILRALGFAWLSREMIKYFFESPFFGFGKHRRSLEDFYQKNLQENPGKACAWRAETLRFFRDTQGIRPLKLGSESLKSEALNELCAKVTDKLTSHDNAFVLRETIPAENAKRQQELANICSGFCLLALELWCQKSRLAVVDDATLFAGAFFINSDLHQPHTSMGMDDDDKKFDGVLPHAVLVPAIRVFGDASGNNLEAEKIISRSCVIIYEEASSSPFGTSASNLSRVPSRSPQPPPRDTELVGSQGSKKRKRAFSEPRITDPREPASDPFEPRSAISEGETRRKSGGSRGPLEQTEQRRSYDPCQKRLEGEEQKTRWFEQGVTYAAMMQHVMAAERAQIPPAVVAQREQESSCFITDQRVDHRTHQLQDVSKNEKSGEQYIGERVTPRIQQFRCVLPIAPRADIDASGFTGVAGADEEKKEEEQERKEEREQEQVAGEESLVANKKIKIEPQD